jgi:hypothetical protein
MGIRDVKMKITGANHRVELAIPITDTLGYT